MLNFLLNLLFPPKCPICKKYVESDGEVCDKCFAAVLNSRKIYIFSEYIEEFWAIANYKQGAREIIRDLKFKSQIKRVKNINYILNKGNDRIPFYPKDIIAVYVPISKARMKERGFNQVELMFKDWLKEKGIKAEKLLIREKSTEHQFSLNPEERKANVKDAFKATRALNGEDILLLDDILTTGATVTECAKALKEAGAGRIFALVFASDD